MKMTNETEVKKLTDGAVKKILTDESTSKSKKMVTLFMSGMSVKDIASLMEVRYNFVYNVVSNYSNVNGIKTETTKKEGKKEKIIELFLQGKSNKEISIELKANSNYVFNTLKEYKIKNNLTTNKDVVAQ